MFRFLRFGRPAEQPKIETQRQTFERLVAELNAALDLLADKPAVTVEPATGHIRFALPDQFPDEALPLPAPDRAEPQAKSPATPKPPVPTPPVPSPPKPGAQARPDKPAAPKT